MRELFVLSFLFLGLSPIYASTDLPFQLLKSVKMSQKLVPSHNCKSIVKMISSTRGITYFKQDEMGARSKEFYFHFTKANLIKANTEDFNKFCEPFKKCADYMKLNKPKIQLFENEGIAEWKIFEGHHVGNHRDCALAFILENKNWQIKSVDFPFDFTP